MNIKFLEKYYEETVLVRYASVVVFKKITWIDHGKIENDAWAHYFNGDGKEYVLIYEDFPGNVYLDNGLTHEVVKVDNDTSIELKYKGERDVPNLAGWFTLYREKER